jgi:hypothetical protein
MFQPVYNTTCFTSGITTLVAVVYVNFPFVKNGCALYTCSISLYQNPTQKYCKEILIVIIRQGREDIFLNRGNKEARLKIVFSSVVYILFFSLLDPLKPFLIIIIN